MDHSDLEELLGAYALHAVDSVEAAAVARHLADCPRCRAEVEAYTEVAAAMSGAGSEAPAGLWDRIAGNLQDDPPPDIPSLVTGVRRPSRRSTRARRVRLGSISLAVAAVALAVALLGLQVADLNSQVNGLRAHQNGLAGAASAALSEPHQTLTLTSATGSAKATVIVERSGQAYWIASNLGHLRPGRTYQLWGLAKGRVVSLGLIGTNPKTYAAFRVQPDTTNLMVTAEPEGGTTRPTTSVLVAATV